MRSEACRRCDHRPSLRTRYRGHNGIVDESAIETRALTKRYRSTRGIEDLTLSVARGEVFGYLGPNGAGKTTTIRTLLDYIRPTSGIVRVLGLDPRTSSVEIKRRTGYLPGELALNERNTGDELVRFAAALRGIDPASAGSLVERLSANLHDRIKTLSHGNKRKIGLILALMHQPELLILDEPTLGIDPLVQREFHLIVREAVARGSTVFLSSHDLSEVEQTCDRVGMIRAGKLVAVDDIGALKSRARRRVEIHFDRPVPAAAFAGIDGVEDLHATGDTIRCAVSGPVDPLVKAASRFTVLDFTTEEASLEDVFLGYYGDNGVPLPEDAA